MNVFFRFFAVLGSMAFCAAAQTVPSAYDLRDEGLAPAMQNQGSSSICWAVASCTAIQSNLLKKGLSPSGANVYVSAWHMAANSGNARSLTYSEESGDYEWDDGTHSWGGDAFSSNVGYLTRGRGSWSVPGATAGSTIATVGGGAVALGSDPRNQIPFDVWSSQESFTEADLPAADQPAALLARGLYRIANEDAALQITAVKNAILTYGAVCSGIDMDDDDHSFSAQQHGGKDTIYYRYTGSAGESAADHEITIIGWDDDYDIDGVKGAWKIQNSWGDPSSGEGDLTGSGVFHVSYNDLFVGKDVTVFDMEMPGRYSDTVLQNDPFFAVENTEPWNETQGFQVATLLDLASMTLGGIGLIGDKDDVISVSLYDAAGWGENGNWDIDPEDALLVMELMFAQDGYSLFDLDQGITLPDGTKLLVVIDYGDEEATDIQYASLGVRDAADYTGLSYVFDGQDWVDLADGPGNPGIYFLKGFGFILIPEPGSCMLVLGAFALLLRRRAAV